MTVRNTSVALTVTALAAGLVGCASTPRDVPELDQARNSLNTVEQDPLAQSAAAVTLQKGQLALNNGQSALERHQPIEIVDHFAYLAQRDAEIAQAQIGDARARATIDQATAERNRIIAEVQTRKAQKQAQSAEERAAQLQREMAELQAKQTDRGYVLSLGDVLFDTGKATLKPAAQANLSRLAAFLNSHPDERVEIDGNTDNTGSADFNQELSQSRANAVRDALLQEGVPDSRIVSRGLGDTMPVATNSTAAGRQQNRRVDVVFLNPQGNGNATVAAGSNPAMSQAGSTQGLQGEPQYNSTR